MDNTEAIHDAEVIKESESKKSLQPDVVIKEEDVEIYRGRKNNQRKDNNSKKNSDKKIVDFDKFDNLSRHNVPAEKRIDWKKKLKGPNIGNRWVLLGSPKGERNKK